MNAWMTDDPLPGLGEVWREAIEASADAWLQFATAGATAAAAMSDAWMRAAAATFGVAADAHGGAPTLVLPDAPDPWAAMRAACLASADPWRAWMPFLRFEVP